VSSAALDFAELAEGWLDGTADALLSDAAELTELIVMGSISAESGENFRVYFGACSSSAAFVFSSAYALSVSGPWKRHWIAPAPSIRIT